MKLLFLFLITGIFISCIFSCTKKDNATEQAEQQLMKIHDEGMAKMDMLLSIRERLKTYNDSSGKAELRSKNVNTILALEQADKAMMAWMRNYHKPDAKISDEEKLRYFQAEFEKMKQVKIQMENSIDSGKTLLQKYRYHE